MLYSIIGIPEDPRREDPDNFLLVFGGYNISDVTDEQVIGVDLIVKVSHVTHVDTEKH